MISKSEIKYFLINLLLSARREGKIVFSVSDQSASVHLLPSFLGKNCFIQKKVLILSSGGEDSRYNGILN